VTVRAEDPPTDRSIPRGKQYWQAQSRSIFYTRTTGIWQPVWLEAVPQNYIERVRITASADGLVRFEAKVTGAEDRDFFAHITNRRGHSRSCGVVHHGRATATVRLANPRLWSPESPNLYDVQFRLGDDRVQSTSDSAPSPSRTAASHSTENHLPQDGPRPRLLARERFDAAHRRSHQISTSA
jgi:hypothetical protein